MASIYHQSNNHSNQQRVNQVHSPEAIQASELTTGTRPHNEIDEIRHFATLRARPPLGSSRLFARTGRQDSIVEDRDSTEHRR